MKIFIERGSSFTTTAEREIVCDVTEKLCHISLNPNTGTKAVMESSGKEETYELPDDNNITVGGERCRCPGVPFQPSTADKEAGGIYDTTRTINFAGGITSFPSAALSPRR